MGTFLMWFKLHWLGNIYLSYNKSGVIWDIARMIGIVESPLRKIISMNGNKETACAKKNQPHPSWKEMKVYFKAYAICLIM